MTQRRLKLMIAVIAVSCWSSAAWADGRDLLAGNAPPDGLGQLPTRARKSASPEITVKLKLEALRSEARPYLKTAQFLPQDVIRLIGEGFGQEAGGRTVQLTLSGTNVALTILSWSDSEIRVAIPDFDGLGIDVKQGAQAHAELARTKKKVVGPNIQIGLMSEEGKWVARRNGMLVMASRDFDGDGVEADLDCDDFDPRRAPKFAEVYDAEGVDEDCDAETVAIAPKPSSEALADLDM